MRFELRRNIGARKLRENSGKWAYVGELASGIRARIEAQKAAK